MLTQQEADDQRCLDAFKWLTIDYFFGTIWWVKEAYVKASYQHYDQNSTRKGHPSLSIQKLPVQTIQDTVLLLYGTSSRPRGGRKAFEVVNLKKCEAEKTYVTYFGTILKPIAVTAPTFFNRTVTPPQEEEPRALEGQALKAFTAFVRERLGR